MVLGGEDTEGRFQTTKKFRCIFCGIEFTKRKPARNSSARNKPMVKGGDKLSSLNQNPHGSIEETTIEEQTPTDNK